MAYFEYTALVVYQTCLNAFHLVSCSLSLECSLSYLDADIEIEPLESTLQSTQS